MTGDAYGPDAHPVQVEDRQALKGQYIRQRKTGVIFKILDVGDEGVTAYQAEGFGGDTFGPENLITWKALAFIYRIMVHVSDIDVKGDQ